MTRIRHSTLSRLAWILWLSLGFPFAASPTTVALLDVGDGELTAEQQKRWQNWRDLLQVQLCQDRSWAVVERSRLDQILQELELRFYGRSAEERAILQGGMLGAELLIQPVVKQQGDAPEVILAVVSTRLAERVGEAALKWPLPPVETFWRESLSKELRSARAVLDRTRSQPTVAVLFFENETKEGRFQYLGEKLEKSLAGALAKAGKFRVLRRQEVVTARPETVLAATGWTQPSALWQAQHADVLVYGNYTTKPDPKVPVDEQPFQVEYTVVSRSHGNVTTGCHPFSLATWGTASDMVSKQIWQMVRPTRNQVATLLSPRKEAEELLERGLRICKVKREACSSNPEITNEHLSDADSRMLRCFLLASFLAPDWEIPWRYFIAMYVRTTSDFGDRDCSPALAMEYFSRFGDMETENGKRLCCIVYQHIALRLAILSQSLKPGTELAGFCRQNAPLFRIAETAFLAAARGPMAPSERPAQLEYAPVIGGHPPTWLAINFPVTMHDLEMIPDKMWVWNLFEKTKPRWRQHPEQYGCLYSYARVSQTPKQRRAAREEIFRWLEEGRQAKKSWSSREVEEVRQLLWRASPARGTESGDVPPSPVILDRSDERLLAKLTESAPVDRSQKAGQVANAWLRWGGKSPSPSVRREPDWESLQHARVQLGKPRWEDVRELGSVSYFFFPTLPLTMPSIKVTTTPVAFWKTAFQEARPDECPYLVGLRVLGGSDRQVYVSLDYQAKYRGSRWTENGAMLFACDEPTGDWRKAATLSSGREASIRSVAKLADRVFVGTQGDGLWIVGPKGNDTRRLSLEDGLPTKVIRTVIALNGQIWVFGGKDRLAIARIDPASHKVFVPSVGDLRSSGAAAATFWNDHFWLVTNDHCLDLDPSSQTVRVHNQGYRTRPAVAATEDYLVLCNTHQHDNVSGGTLCDALRVVDRSLKISNHGAPVCDSYNDSVQGSACLAAASHADLGWAGETENRTCFGFAAGELEGVRGSMAEVEYLKSGKMGLMWNKDVWLRDYKSKLLPRTRMPIASCLAGDGKWLWIGSGKRLFLYRPDLQTWHGVIELPWIAWNIAVTRRSIWLGTDGLHKGAGLLRIDREAALKGALENGLPNDLTTKEVEEAIRRLPMGDQGVFYFGLGRFTEAAKCLDQAVEVDITEPQYFLGLFMIHSPWGLNQPEKFQRYGDRLMELYPSTTWSGTVKDWRTYAKTNPPKKEARK